MTERKKYELTDEFIEHWSGKKLYRIKALIDFGLVVAGSLGCFVESENNLDHNGNARVYGDARVYGNAEVCEQRSVIWFSVVGTENGTLTIYKSKDGSLLATRGCFSGTVDEFLAKSAQVHDEKTKREYELLIEVAKSRILG